MATDKAKTNGARDARILRMREDGKTFNEIGEAVGLSGSRIRLIIQRDKPKLLGRVDSKVGRVKKANGDGHKNGKPRGITKAHQARKPRKVAKANGNGAKNGNGRKEAVAAGGAK